MQSLACEVCGQLPHPHRLRLTLAKLAAVLPIELALHALVVAIHPPYLVSVVALALTTTILVVWVVEPSAMRLLTRWLHAPALRTHGDFHAAEALWRVRMTLRDQPGALERVAHELTDLRASILSLHVHPLEVGVLDEIVVGCDAALSRSALIEAVRRGGATDVRVWATTALALVDGQTRALSLAARVAHHPEELPDAVAELLGARTITDRALAAGPSQATDPGETILRIPSPWSGLFTFARPDSPFTPAERARAHRLAQIAEVSALGSRQVVPRSHREIAQDGDVQPA
jgi:hypothetical protein